LFYLLSPEAARLTAIAIIKHAANQKRVKASQKTGPGSFASRAEGFF